MRDSAAVARQRSSVEYRASVDVETFARCRGCRKTVHVDRCEPIGPSLSGDNGEVFVTASISGGCSCGSTIATMRALVTLG